MGTLQSPLRSQAATPNYRVIARFELSTSAKRVCAIVRETIRTTECNLSVYNLRLSGEPFVVVLGDAPPPALDARLRRLLAVGNPAD